MTIVVTIREDDNVSQRSADNLFDAIYSALLAHDDYICGELDGLFAGLAKVMVDLWQYQDWDHDEHDEKVADALSKFLQSRASTK